MGAVHVALQQRHHHLHHHPERWHQPRLRAGRREHGQQQRGQILHHQPQLHLGHQPAHQRPHPDLSGSAGRQQRVRGPGAARELERTGLLRQPGLHRHVPPRPPRQPALDGQPQAIPHGRQHHRRLQHPALSGRRLVGPLPFRVRLQRGPELGGHGLHLALGRELLDLQGHQPLSRCLRRLLDQCHHHPGRQGRL